MAASPDQQPWSFDVSSLMVLIGESEEANYRLSLRSLTHCIAMAPVVGLQNYLRSYDFLLEPGPLTYFTPYGCKNAPLRNIQLCNAIKHEKLLEDGRFTVYRIARGPASASASGHGGRKKYDLILWLWIGTTWVVFGGLLAFWFLVPDTTWISIAVLAAITGWSILLRIIEHFNVGPAPVDEKNVTGPDEDDAVFIVGRNNSAFVLEGSRKDIKDWTARGLRYRASFLGISAAHWQAFTRVGSLLVLLFIFSAIPNGSTVDQVAFILINTMAQLNVLVGKRLTSKHCLSTLIQVDNTYERTRTHIYAKILRRFKGVGKGEWVDVWGLLPQTAIWNRWRLRVVEDMDGDAKVLYNEISEELKASSRKAVVSAPPSASPITSTSSATQAHS